MSRSGPLAGVRVIDLSVAAAGPLATSLLAEQGADVVKVERPGGDFMRRIGTVRGDVSGVFAGFNRGKRSVCVDLKEPRGIDVVRRLVAAADVLLHNMRPGVAERIGVGEAAMRAVRPDLVYVAISGWGLAGPRATSPAYDSVVQAASGFAAHQGGMPSGEPTFVRNTVCDKATGLTTAQLVTAALFARARHGEGQSVHVSMLHASLAFLWPDGMQDVTFLDAPDTGGPKATPPPVHRTADGWIAISSMLDQEFVGLCDVLRADAVAADDRFALGGPRSRHSAAMWELLDPLIATWPTDELAGRLDAAGVPNAPVRPVDELADDPQVVANGLLVDVHHDLVGAMRVPRPVGDFSRDHLSPPTPAPWLGEHTDAVLAEAGIDAAERAELRRAGVIA